MSVVGLRDKSQIPSTRVSKISQRVRAKETENKKGNCCKCAKVSCFIGCRAPTPRTTRTSATLPYPNPAPAPAAFTLRFLGSTTRTIKFAGSWICVVASRHNTLQCVVVVVAHAIEDGEGGREGVGWLCGCLVACGSTFIIETPTNQTKNPNRVAPNPAIPSALVHIKAITGHTWNLKGSPPLCLPSPPGTQAHICLTFTAGNMSLLSFCFWLWLSV